MPDPGEQVFAVSPLPTHLWQLDKQDTVNVKGMSEQAFNDMGCGAYSTAMAMSVHDPKYGSEQAATDLYNRMSKVFFSRGTWEGENAKQAAQAGFVSAQLHNGTADELADLIRVNAAAVMNMEPGHILFVEYGAHDMTLVGCSTISSGAVQKIFVLDPWLPTGNGSVGGHPDYPGNRYFVTDDTYGEKLATMWTGTFTPIFKDADQARQWLAKHPTRASSFSL